MIERQEIHCHACDNYVQFDLDTELNGNHVLHCPVCQHEHCRRVENGRITDVRWDQRNDALQTFRVTSNITYTTTSTFDTTNSSSYFLYGSWMNTTSATTSSTFFYSNT